MPNILGYHVFDQARGWLEDDEKSWTPDFGASACFSTAELANDLGERQSPGVTETFYVMAVLGSF